MRRSPLFSLLGWAVILGALAVFWMLVFLLVDKATAARKPETNYQKASRIVRAVFPDATEDAALRVVRCETGGSYNVWAYNPSGASGYFQVLQGNAGRVLYGPPTWDRRSKVGIVIPRGTRLFLPWTNTRVAFYLSRGGTDWSEWVCRP